MANNEDQDGAERSAGGNTEETGREQEAKPKSQFRQVPVSGEMARDAGADANVTTTQKSGGGNGAAAGGMGFTQLFQSLSNESEHSAPLANDSEHSAPAKAAAAFRAEPLPRPRTPSAEAWSATGVSGAGMTTARRPQAGSTGRRDAGDFTRMFERLGDEGSLPAAASPVRNQPSAAGFTQLLQTLSEEEERREQPALAAVTAAPRVTAGGPGEFTRVISGSMLREAQGKMALGISSHTRATTPATTQPEYEIGAGVANAEPVQQSAGQPELPRVAATFGAGVPMAAVSQPAPGIKREAWISLAAGGMAPTHAALPVAPQMPQVPSMMRLAATNDGWQRYLPLLLITNLFLMLLVLVALGILLYRR